MCSKPLPGNKLDLTRANNHATRIEHVTDLKAAHLSKVETCGYRCMIFSFEETVQ